MSYKITDTIIVDNNKNIASIGTALFAGPVIIGGGTSTGTVSQPLQVTGSGTPGAYISGNVGIGSTNPTSKLWVSGDIYNAGVHTAYVLNASKDPGTGIATDFTNSLFGNGWRVSSPGSTTYYKLATLPPGGGGSTFDHLIINGVLGAWTNGNQTPFEITFSNRGSFNYKYVSYGSVRSDVRIIGISTNSSVEIWAQHQASQFTKLVYNIPNSIESIVVSNPTSTTTAPTGTTVFDSSTVTPRFIINESDYVGIGTTNPTSKLHVVGDASISGLTTTNNLYVSGVGTFLSSGLKIRNPANTFGYTIAGGAIAADRTLTLPVVTSNTGIAVTGLDQSFTGTQTFSSINASAAITFNTTASNILIGTGQTNPVLTLGGAAQTGTMTLGQSTVSQTTNIQAGVSGVGTTKTINLGTGGASGSFTQINIGPTAGVGTVVINSGTNLLVGTTTATGTASQPLQVTGGAYVSGSVGIGTTNPGATLNVVPTATSIAGLFSGTTSGDMVRITQLGSGNALVVEDSANPDSSPFVVRGDGSVGIGTTNPTATLTVAGNSANILIGKQYATANTITLNGSTATADYNILSTSANNLFINRPSGKTITFAQADLSHANFDTSNNFILNSGNLAIGNFTPTYALDAGAASLNKAGRVGSIIFGTAGTSYGIVGYNAKPSALNAWTYDATDVASWIQFLSGGHVFYRAASGTAANSITALESGRFDSSGNLLIGAATSTGITSQRLQVTGGAYVSGNLGIGTALASQSLHVQGNARITGALRDSSDQPGTSGQVLRSTVSGTEWFSSAGISGISVRNEGTTVGTALGITSLDFVGGIITASATGGAATITVSGIAGITVRDEGTTVGTALGITSLDFVGGIITASATGGAATITVSGIAGITVRDESATVGTTGGTTTLNFTGSNVTASQTSAGYVTVDIDSILGITVRDESATVGTTGGTTTLNFTGSNVTASQTSAGYVTVDIDSIAGITVRDESTLIGSALGTTTLNFTGSNVTASQTSAGYVTVDIDSILGITVRDESTLIGSALGTTTLNFTGSNVTASQTSAGYVTVAIRDNLIGTGVSISGISTLGTVIISSGIITATSGIVTYYGDGSNLTGVNISSGISISTNTTNQAQYLTYAIGTGTTSGLGIGTASLVFNPSNNYLGIGTTNPTAQLETVADAKISGLTIGKGTANVISNTAIGYQALLSNTTGSFNTDTGYRALYANTTGQYNTANGYQALYANTTGTNNTAVGYQSLFSNTTGISNTAVGHQSLTTNTTGTSNTAVGYQSLNGTTIGTNNTAVGYGAGNANTTGLNNTFLGNGAVNTAGGATASNTIVLGDASVTTLRCNTATISALSDKRDKKEIINIPLGLDFLNELRPVKFTWDQRNGGRVDIPDSGFIAQEALETVMNYDADWFGLVDHQNPEHFEMSAGKLIPVLVKAVQELSQQNQELKTLIDSIVEKT